MLNIPRKLQDTSWYVGTAGLCVALLVYVMELWKANFYVPLSIEYSGDSLFYLILAKGTIENGWYWHNSHIGMPVGGDLYNFPHPAGFEMSFVKISSLFTSDHTVIINILFLLSFPLATLTSLYVFRHFNIAYPIATLGSLLYAFLPFHFFRGISHLTLSTYFSVPLIVLVILWICSGEMILLANSKDVPGRMKVNLKSSKPILSIVACILIASTGHAYFGAFACFFLAFAGVLASLHRKKIHYLLVSGIMVAIIFSVVIVQVLPSVLYTFKNGSNQVASRLPRDAEIYSLKISQLLLPVDGHRLPRLANLKAQYNSEEVLYNENTSVTLGFIGSIGFLGLLGLLFYKDKSSNVLETNSIFDLIKHMSKLNIMALLLAKTGGFSMLFAFFISTQIRAYNRISIYIAFFSLFAVVLALEYSYRKFIKTGFIKTVFHCSLFLLLMAGIYDQTWQGFVPNYSTMNAEYDSDAKFVNQIEASLPTNAMIFQLPYAPFPVVPAIHNMGVYSHFRSYLHSKTLRWSYGAMSGGVADIWQQNVVALPIEPMVEALSFSGFSGIYIDRYGYADNDRAKLETELSSLLKMSPLISKNGRLIFFNITEYNQQLRELYTPQAWTQKQESALSPTLVSVSWKGGCSDLEGKPEMNWRWCSSEGELQVTNFSQQTKKVALEMSFATGHPEISNLRIDGSTSFSENVRVNAQERPYSVVLTLQPGKQSIRFWCDAPRVNAPNDPRILVVRINNFKIKRLE